MGFIPPLNLGNFQPSPATLSQWIYQIWQYLQENPIATQEQLQEYIGTFITTSPETQTMIGEGVEQYLTDNPPQAPVQSVQGKTGAVQLAYNEIVPASNAIPVYKASSTPNTNTLVGQYNLGYRLFVNTATQEIYTITPAGALSLVGRGKFDGTTIDLDTAQGDTTISEEVTAIEASIGTIQNDISNLTNKTMISTTLSGDQAPELVAGQYVKGASITLPKGLYVIYGEAFYEPSSGTSRTLALRIGTSSTEGRFLFYDSFTTGWCCLNTASIIDLQGTTEISVYMYSSLSSSAKCASTLVAAKIN